MPAATGTNVTLITQLPPAAIAPPHALVWLKSSPVAMLKMVKVAAPLLVRVTIWEPLELATA